MPRIALAQLSMSAHLEDNLAKSLNAMEEAAGKGADLVVFPEIQLAPFFPQHEDFDAEPFALEIDDPVIGKFRDACRRLKLNAAPNIYLREGGKLYDASLLIDRAGAILGVSKMVHITQASAFYEQNYYAPSTEGFRVFDTDCGRVGIVICFDRHFPESFRAAVRQGADIVLVPTVNMEGEPLDMFEWEMRLAAFHNSLAVAMCNRVGREGDARYAGRSLVAGPAGDVLMRANGEEGLYYADYDLNAIAARRRENAYLKLYNAEAFGLGG